MSKCKKVDGKIEKCKGLEICLNDGLGGFEIITLANMQTEKSQHVLRVGSSKKNRVIVNYCPACGGDIKQC